MHYLLYLKKQHNLKLSSAEIIGGASELSVHADVSSGCLQALCILAAMVLVRLRIKFCAGSPEICCLT